MSPVLDRRSAAESSRLRPLTLLLAMLVVLPHIVRADPQIRWNPDLAAPIQSAFDEDVIYEIGDVFGLVEHRGDLVAFGDINIRLEDAETQEEIVWSTGGAILAGGVILPVLPGRDLLPAAGSYYDRPTVEVRCAASHGDLLVFGGRIPGSPEFACSNVFGVDVSSGEPHVMLGAGLSWVPTALLSFEGALIAGRELVSRSVSSTVLARWDGESWVDIPLPSDVDYAAVRALVEFEGELWVGGMFLREDELPHEGRAVAVWNGSSWRWPDDGLRSSSYAPNEMLPNGIQGVTSFEVFQSSLYAGGSFANEGTGPTGVARWDGSAWQTLGTRNADVRDLVATDSGLVALGYATQPLANGRESTGICAWDGSAWIDVTGPGGGVIEHLLFATAGAVHDGQFVFAADELTYEHSPTGARMRFFKWSPMGTRLYDGGTWTHRELHQVLARPDGIVFAGDFETMGNVVLPMIGRWNGVDYQAMSAGIRGIVGVWFPFRILLDIGGRVVLGGEFEIEGAGADHLARWNGERWVSFAGGLYHEGLGYGSVLSATTFEGDTVFAGRFAAAGQEDVDRLVRYGSTGWEPWSAPIPGTDVPGFEGTEPRVHSMAATPTELYVSIRHWGSLPEEEAGSTQPISRIVVWDGVEWSEYDWGEPLPQWGALLHAYDDNILATLGFLSASWILGDGGRRPLGLPARSNGGANPALATARVGDSWWILGREGIYEADGNGFSTVASVAVAKTFSVSGNRVALAGIFDSVPGRVPQGLEEGFIQSAVPAIVVQLGLEREADRLRFHCDVTGTRTPDRLILERRRDDSEWLAIDERSLPESKERFTDVATGSTHHYRVAAEFAESRVHSNVVEVVPRDVRRSRIVAVAPNPFNPRTRVDFVLARSGRVRIDVYALNGRRVASEVLGDLPAGAHGWTWNGNDDRGTSVASGSYVVRVTTPDRNLSARVRLVK